MAMVLVQQPTQRTAEFRTRIAKLAADKHEEIMCRCVGNGKRRTLERITAVHSAAVCVNTARCVREGQCITGDRTAWVWCNIAACTAQHGCHHGEWAA